MRTRLVAHQGVVYLAHAAGRGRVDLFDLGGRRLEGGFEFDPVADAAGIAAQVELAGLGVDDDRRLWIADGAARCVRGFTVFGREGLRLGAPGAHRVLGGNDPDAAGVIGSPSAIAASGHDEELRLLVGSAGRRRHGLHLFATGGQLVRSLRPRGDSHGRFAGIAAVAIGGARLFAAEHRAARVQVFEGTDHWFDVEPRDLRGGPVRVVALDTDSGAELLMATIGAADGSGGEVLWLEEGRWDRPHRIAGAGTGPGEVDEPVAVALARDEDRGEPLAVVADRSGTRLQLFALDGTCYGEFTGMSELP